MSRKFKRANSQIESSASRRSHTGAEPHYANSFRPSTRPRIRAARQCEANLLDCKELRRRKFVDTHHHVTGQTCAGYVIGRPPGDSTRICPILNKDIRDFLFLTEFTLKFMTSGHGAVTGSYDRGNEP